MALVSKAFGDIITFTRASSATFTNSSGLIELAATDEPRLDYDPATLAPKGLLIEEARTNLLLQSGWAGAVAGSPGTAPTSWSLAVVGAPSLGVSAAEFGSSDSANALTFNCADTERSWVQQSVTVVNGTQYSVPVWVESVTGSVGSAVTVVAVTATATINTVVTNPTTSGRYTFVFTATSSGTVAIRFGVGTTAGISGSASIRLSRPQLEAGSFPTSYIPTTTAAATRAADIPVMTGTNFSSWYRQDEGTFFVEYAGVTTLRAFAVNDGTSGNVMAMAITTVNAVFDGYVGGAYQGGLFVSGSYISGTRYKHAASYQLNNSVASLNGTLSAVDTSYSIPLVDRMRIGANTTGANYLNGHIQRITYYPRRLTEAELEAITT